MNKVNMISEIKTELKELHKVVFIDMGKDFKLEISKDGCNSNIPLNKKGGRINALILIYLAFMITIAENYNKLNKDEKIIANKLIESISLLNEVED